MVAAYGCDHGESEWNHSWKSMVGIPIDSVLRPISPGQVKDPIIKAEKGSYKQIV